jgi:hypothetical protein
MVAVETRVWWCVARCQAMVVGPASRPWVAELVAERGDALDEVVGEALR